MTDKVVFVQALVGAPLTCRVTLAHVYPAFEGPPSQLQIVSTRVCRGLALRGERRTFLRAQAGQLKK